MARSKLVTIRGPWRGMEERDGHRTPDQCAIAQNIIFCDGTIRPRQGFEVVKTLAHASQARFQVHPVTVEGRLQYVLAVGPGKRGVNSFLFINNVWEPDGASFQDLVTGYGGTKKLHTGPGSTLLSLGNIDWEGFQCSFKEFPLAVEDPSTGTVTTSHRVVFIFTKAGVHFFDVDAPHLGIQEASVDDHAILHDAVNEAYFENTPKANIVTEYRNAFVYAGFSRNTKTALTNPIPEDQDYISEHMIDRLDSETMTLNPHFFVISNPWAPLSIKARANYNVDATETITGLAEFMESLVVFTDENIWIGNGFGGSFALRKAVSGIGCVSHHSIVEVRGALYFMSHDGVYALIGAADGGAVKVSKPIDSFWSGRHQTTHVPAAYANDMTDMHWPFKIGAKALELCQGMHVRSMNQIWWSVPKKGGSRFQFPITLVYDYVNQAWSYFYSALTDYASSDCCMYDGFTVREGNEETIFTVSANGELMRYGHPWDRNGAIHQGIPVVYDSGRVFSDNDEVATVRPLRFKLWSRAKSSVATPQFFVEGEEAHRDVEVNGEPLAEADRQHSSGDLPLHPDAGNQYFWDTAAWSGGSAISVAAASVVAGEWQVTLVAAHGLVSVGKVTVANMTTVDSGLNLVSPDPINGLRTVTVLSATVLQIDNPATAVAGHAAISGGTITVSGTRWADLDWFSAKIECGTMRSRSFRFGFEDNSRGTPRAPLVHMQSVSLEYTGEDNR